MSEAKQTPAEASRTTLEPPDFPKGHRPQVFDDPAIDQLYAAYVALGTELAVAFDRIDTLERLLQQRLQVSREEIERFQPDAESESMRQARRADLAARLLRPFREFRDDRITRAERKR